MGVPHTRWTTSLKNITRRCSPAEGRIQRRGRIARASSKVQSYHKSHYWAEMAAAHLSKLVLDWLEVWYPCHRVSRLWGGRMCSRAPLGMAKAGHYHRVWTWLIAPVKGESQGIRQECIPRRLGTWPPGTWASDMIADPELTSNRTCWTNPHFQIGHHPRTLGWTRPTFSDPRLVKNQRTNWIRSLRSLFYRNSTENLLKFY